MKQLIKISLLFLIFLSGCVTFGPEIRYMQSYNKPLEFQSYIQGSNYKLWYDNNLHEQFIEIDKSSYIWNEIRKSSPGFSVDRFFSDPENGIMLMITKSPYKYSYRRFVKEIKKDSDATLIKGDQRMVNRNPVLYTKGIIKMDSNNLIFNYYCINHDNGSLQLMISCPEHNYEKFEKDIQNALNGIEIY